jgi:hypothetical protein
MIELINELICDKNNMIEHLNAIKHEIDGTESLREKILLKIYWLEEKKRYLQSLYKLLKIFVIFLQEDEMHSKTLKHHHNEKSSEDLNAILEDRTYNDVQQIELEKLRAELYQITLLMITEGFVRETVASEREVLSLSLEIEEGPVQSVTKASKNRYESFYKRIQTMKRSICAYLRSKLYHTKWYRTSSPDSQI